MSGVRPALPDDCLPEYRYVHQLSRGQQLVHSASRSSLSLFLT
jgi:hypothetical protein